MNKTVNLYERVCTCCGKNFEAYKSSIYKRHVKGTKGKTDYFCSYSCYSKGEKKNGVQE